MDVEAVNIEYVPTGHGIQAVILLPVVEAYVPALHLMQLKLVDVPVAVVYFPAPQSIHAPAASREYFPKPQSVQLALPVLVLYLPAAHGEQTPPSGPVYPASQTATIQAALDELAMGEV